MEYAKIVIQAGARKERGGTVTVSGEQEGLSNTTDNPFMNEPGKSKKGEGETETAKWKGTFSQRGRRLKSRISG